MVAVTSQPPTSLVRPYLCSASLTHFSVCCFRSSCLPSLPPRPAGAAAAADAGATGVPLFLLRLLNAGAASRSVDKQEALPGQPPTTPVTEMAATDRSLPFHR
jgi:hypothetical protein